MPRAHYVVFHPTAGADDDVSPTDRVGGLPSHLPPRLPTSRAFGTEYCFLPQIVALERAGLDGWRCLQLYQSGEIERGDDPAPIVVMVPLDAPPNERRQGRSCPGLEPARIEWEEREDPAAIRLASFDDELVWTLDSKLGGTAQLDEPPVPGARFVGQITEAAGSRRRFGRFNSALRSTTSGPELGATSSRDMAPDSRCSSTERALRSLSAAGSGARCGRCARRRTCALHRRS